MPATSTRRPGGERERTAAGIDRPDMEARVRRILSRWPAVGLAVGVVRDGRLDFFHGHGLADVASATPVTEDTVFRIGSITKTFTAIAVMQLWERGLVDLDAPANRYLRAYRLVPARARITPPTVRQLLTHTAGIRELLHPTDVLRPLFGEIVRHGRSVPSPAEYYRGDLRVDAQPGSRFIYTDHDFTTLGQIVEDVSGEPLDRYLRERLFGPLGMSDTDLVRSARIRRRLATGYVLRAGGPRPVADYEVVTSGGGGAYSTPRDMAGYVAALTGGGANEHGSVLQPATLATMFEAHYRPDPRVPGVGLAFSRVDLGGHPAVEHGGILPGFDSQIFVAPGDGAGVLAFTNGARLAMLWLPGAVAGLLAGLLGAREDGIRTDVPHHPEIWAEVCGWYPLSARLTDARTRAMIGAGAEVFVRGDRLVLRGLSPIPALYRGFALHPDDPGDPYAFRIDLSRFGMGTGRVLFSREPGGGGSVHFDLHPLSLRKGSAISNPRYWATGAAGALAAAAAVAAARRSRGRRHREART